MALVSILLKKVILPLTITWAIAFPFLAAAGGTSGGGAGKSANMIARENIRAILEDEKIAQYFGQSFGIESISLYGVKDDGYHYVVKANSIIKQHPCEIEVVVWNTMSAGLDEIAVRDVKVHLECSFKKTEQLRTQSVHQKYRDEFEKFPSGMSETRLYEEYLKAALSISPEKRKEMREHMRTSDPKYFEAFSKSAKGMSNFFKRNPKANENQALYTLAQAMDYDASGGGIHMALIVALKLAPIFIVDAE